MRHSLFRRMQCLLLAGSLMGLCGCAGMMDVGPTPPAFLAPVDLNGPYDADIPAREASQIKKASLMMDWAVPYIFVSVAAHFESTGDQVRSIHFFNRAMEEFHKRNNLPGEGSAFSRKISSLYHAGEIQTAYLAIGEQEKKWSEAPLCAFVFYNYGYYHLKNGDYARARDYFRRVLAVHGSDTDYPDWQVLKRDTELGYGMALILADTFPSVSGRLCLADFDEAFYQNIRRNISEGLLHLDQVSALHKNILNTNAYRYFPEMIPLSLECDLYNFRGLAYGIMGKGPQAVKNLEKAADLARRADYRLGEADNIFFASQVHLLDKNRPKGIRSAQDLEDIAERYQLASYAIWARMILAHQYWQTGDTDRTIDSLDKALTLMESNDSWLPRNADFRGIGVFKRQAVYETLLEMHAGKRDAREAFKTAERSKVAQVADWLGGMVIGTTPAAPERIKRIGLYRVQMAEQYARLLSPAIGDAVFRRTAEKLDQVRKDYVIELADMKEQDEALHSLIGVVPPDPGEIQRLLDSDTTLFTYYVSRHYLYIWVISQQGFHQEKIRISRDDVDRLVQTYLRAMMDEDKGLVNALSERVYDLFLKRVVPFVYGDRLGIVPHGTLYNLPFASMRYVKSYLVDGFSLFHLPHAGMLKQVLSKKLMPETGKKLIFAEPPQMKKQPTVQTAERDILKRLFPQADYFAADNASKADLQKLTDSYDMIHLAADCNLTEEAPLDSGLRWNATEWLDVRDMVRLQLKGNAAVLSGCQIKKGLSATGAGVPALTSAWLYTVSPSVVASLWRIEDKARAVWVEMFYKNLEQNGRMGDALRATQNEMIQKGYGPHEWAAFILIGRY